MALPDDYSILGVLPEAEDCAIVAAYRALARRQHPDTWTGDPGESHRRMSEINEAYGVLGDAGFRADYDRKRDKTRSGDYEAGEWSEREEAFSAALRNLEDRWSVAVGIFPDLADTRRALSKTSATLAFGFVTTLLEHQATSTTPRV